MEYALFMARCRDLLAKHPFNLYDLSFFDGERVHSYQHQPANPANNSYSVSKMFTMTAIGMLADEGKLSLTDKLTRLLEGVLPPSYNHDWDRVTVFDTLAHKTGMERGVLDIYGDDPRPADFLSTALNLLLPYAPGTTYRYSDDAYYLLSRVVSAVSGETLLEYLRPRLFNPLGFSEVAWSTCPAGYQLGGDCLYCTTPDMLKLGILFLQGGVYEGQQLLSKEFVSYATENNLGMAQCEAKSHGKTGSKGQIIAFCPESNRALAIHSYEIHSYDFRGAAIRELLEKD
ncbi:MAG: serine hydrolase [Clostridia bacterium]|nr:serine hydrolase [Clostridia bacterium]